MSATNRGCERKAYDFYATPPETVRAFLANFDGISSGDRILEPSAGNGQIVKVLREGGYDNRIDAVELRPEERGTLEALADNVTIGSFFDYEPDCGYDVIIGNPPYSLALDFINKSLELLQDVYKRQALEHPHFKNPASTMWETTCVKLCAHGRIMKLLKPAGC